MLSVEEHKVINQIISVFHFIGVWQNKNGRVYQKIGSKLFYLMGSWMLIVCMGYGAFLCNDWSEKIFLASVATIGVVHLARIIYVLWKKDEILAFIDQMCTHSVRGRGKLIDIQHKLKYFLDFICAYISMIIIGYMCIFITSLPLFWSHKRLAVSVLFSIILWYVMLNCSIKYKILGHQFAKLGYIPVGLTTRKKLKMSEATIQKSYLEEFIGLFKIYQELRKTIDEFKSFFSPLFFIQITTSGLLICCMIYGLVFTYDQNLIDALMNVVGIIYCIFDIFMVMHFGNEIKMSSDGLSFSLFQSNWMDQSRQCKICVIIFNEILKLPQELVIGKLYPLNLNTFTSVMNLAYRSFHILKNLK